MFEALRIGMNAFVGNSYEPDPGNGCCWAATGIAAYYSPWAANEHRNGVFYVPTLCAHADQAGILYDFSEDNLDVGDIIVFGDQDHVVIATGGYGYVGNSSSRGYVVEGSDYRYMGLPATQIVKVTKLIG